MNPSRLVDESWLRSIQYREHMQYDSTVLKSAQIYARSLQPQKIVYKNVLILGI